MAKSTFDLFTSIPSYANNSMVCDCNFPSSLFDISFPEASVYLSLSRGCSELNIFFKRSFDLPIDTPFILIVSSVIRFSIQLSTQSFVSISVVSNNSEIASPNNFINSCLDSNVFSNNILCPRYAGSNLGEKTLNILDVLFLIADIEDKAKFDNKPLVMSANSSTIKVGRLSYDTILSFNSGLCAN